MKKYLLLLLFVPLTALGATQGVSFNTVTKQVLQTDLDFTMDDLTSDTGAFATTLTLGGSPVGTSANNLSFFAATTSAQLASKISDETGSGALVFGTSPTIVTPTIASFANATHTHQSAAGGGTLDAAAIAAGTVATARLGSGVADNTKFLRGDSTWQVPAGGGGSAPVGTMVNVGNNIVGGIPVAADTTDTNYVPSSVTISGGTNLLAGTVHGTNQVSGGRFIGTGPTADSRIDVPDDDETHYFGFQANNTTTTSVNLVGPAAPFTGFALFTASGTNWTPAAATTVDFVVAYPNFQTNAAITITTTTITNKMFDLHDDVHVLTDNTTIATDCSIAMNFLVELGGNRTLGAPTNGKGGRFYTFDVVQDATGNRTLSLATNFVFGTDITGITLSTNATYLDSIRVQCSSRNTNVFYVKGFVRGYP
jgi:hypothetical protein